MGKIETQFWSYADRMKNGFIFAMLTDEIMWESWPLENEKRRRLQERESELLDVRIFDEEKELRMFRGDIGKAFRCRSLEDEAGKGSIDFFDEEQYLDIDAKRSAESFDKDGYVWSTGGGYYHLPLSGFEDAKVKVRNYLGYYEGTGQAYVKDWRLVNVFQEKGKEK